jgi:hypothetical protein
MKDRRIYFILVVLFFVALLDLYFWSHVLSGDNRYGCSIPIPGTLVATVTSEQALTLAVTIIAVLVGFAVRFISNRRL